MLVNDSVFEILSMQEYLDTNDNKYSSSYSDSQESDTKKERPKESEIYCRYKHLQTYRTRRKKKANKYIIRSHLDDTKENLIDWPVQTKLLQDYC